MRNVVTKFLFPLVVLFFSFSCCAQNDIAIAKKINGVLVFTDSEPVCEYEVVARVKSGMSWSGKYNEIRDKLIRKAIKEDQSVFKVFLFLGLSVNIDATVEHNFSMALVW